MLKDGIFQYYTLKIQRFYKNFFEYSGKICAFWAVLSPECQNFVYFPHPLALLKKINNTIYKYYIGIFNTCINTNNCDVKFNIFRNMGKNCASWANLNNVIHLLNNVSRHLRFDNLTTICVKVWWLIDWLTNVCVWIWAM